MYFQPLCRVIYNKSYDYTKKYFNATELKSNKNKTNDRR